MYKYAVFGYDPETKLWHFLATGETTGDADDIMADPMHTAHYERMRKCRILDATSAYIDLKLKELNEGEI